jgi:RNA polymerase primary sigma factor
MSITELHTGTRRPASPGQLLSAPEEAALAVRIGLGHLDAKEEMIERNLGLVRALARTYRGRSVPFDDLVQEGTVGLVKAVERFDPGREVKFSTYAVWWIRRSMLDALAGSKLIRVPAKANRQLAAVRRTEAELERGAPRRASDAEIAERLELTETAVRSLRAAARVTASLDQPLGEDTIALCDLVVDEEAVDPPAAAIELEARDEVSAMLRLLPARHREVLIRRYGLNDRPVYTHEEIGKWLGVGEERSRQIEHEALHRLRSISAPAASTAKT